MKKFDERLNRIYPPDATEIAKLRAEILEGGLDTGHADEHVLRSFPYFTKDKAVALRILPHKPEFYSELDANLQIDRDVALVAVSTNGLELSHMLEFQDDEEIVSIAVQGKGSALAFASDRLRDTEHIVELALKKNPDAVFYASKRLQEKYGKKE